MSSYTNPVIKGFNPDPSVINVNGIFYAATSSFHLFPGIPIYVSYNLTDWRQIGNVICDENQGIDFSTNGINRPTEKDVYMSGLYAPTLRYHEGRFYVICTNTFPKVAGADFYPYNFICYTDDIYSGKWSKAHYVDDFYGIDPDLFWDSDNKCYMQGAFIYGYDKPIANSIHQVQINPNTGERLSEEYEICAGWSKVVSEGPHMYRKDDWYYLIFAEGGTFDDHMLCVARSDNVKGPFIPYENNPFATNKFHKEEYVQWVGHGDIVRDNNDQYWALVLAGRNVLTSNHPLSRETFLTPIKWPKNGWPKAEIIKINMQVDQKLPLSDKSVQDLVPQWFEQSILTYLFIRYPKLENFDYNYSKGTITMHSGTNSLEDYQGPVSFIGKRQPDLVSTHTVQFDIHSSVVSSNIRYGVSVYKDQMRFIEFGIDTSNNKLYLSVKSIGETEIIFQTDFNVSNNVKLEIRSTEKQYHFYHEDKAIGSVDTSKISTQEFTGTIYGVFAIGSLSTIVFSQF